MTASSQPMIGDDVPWNEVEAQVFRVTGYALYASIDGAKIVHIDGRRPYAVLTVQSPAKDGHAHLPLNHRDNFVNFCELLEHGLTADNEILVTYMPYRGRFERFLRSWRPPLRFTVLPKGELERCHAEASRPVAEQIFGKRR